ASVRGTRSRGAGSWGRAWALCRRRPVPASACASGARARPATVALPSAPPPISTWSLSWLTSVRRTGSPRLSSTSHPSYSAASTAPASASPTPPSTRTAASSSRWPPKTRPTPRATAAWPAPPSASWTRKTGERCASAGPRCGRQPTRSSQARWRAWRWTPGSPSAPTSPWTPTTPRSLPCCASPIWTGRGSTGARSRSLARPGVAGERLRHIRDDVGQDRHRGHAPLDVGRVELVHGVGRRVVDPEVPARLRVEAHARHALAHEWADVRPASAAHDARRVDRALAEDRQQQLLDGLDEGERLVARRHAEADRREHAAVGLDGQHVVLDLCGDGVAVGESAP